MASDNAFQHCLDAAYRYLTYRPRSEGEMRQRLHHRQFDTDVVERTIAKLKEQELIDDYAFAQFWKDNRLSFKPKSKRLIEKELNDRKVAREIVEQVTENINDESIAYKLGCNRMPTLAHLDYPDFHRRLSNYLSYRGFSYEVVKRTIALLWQQKDHY